MFIQMLLMLLLCSGADSCSSSNALSITTPSPMQALSGTCLFIPCTYKPLSPPPINTTNSVTGIWCNQSKFCSGSEFSVSGNPSKSYPMNITGNLKNKDCTTMFYNLSQKYQGDYYFRVKNDPYTATALCPPLHITVRDSPWIPSIEVSGDQTETEVVTITCSAVTPCPHAPPELTWDLHQGTANVIQTNSNGTFITKISLNITLTDSHDGLMIKCNASYPVSGGFKTTNSNVTLSVSYGPKDTSVVVSPSGSLSAGQSVTLSCSSRAKPPVHHFTWFRRSSQGTVNVSEGQTYSFNICEGGENYCVASNKHSNGSSSDIKLQITDSPWIPSLKVSGDQTETEVVTITCSAFTPCPRAPPKLTWDLHQGTANVIQNNSNGTFITKISLNITLTDSHDGLMIKCNASYPVRGGFKTTNSNVTLSVSYGPKDTSVVVSPSGSLSAGQSVTLSCSSRAKPPVHHFTWFRRSSQGTANISEGRTYSFNICEGEEYYCVASNKHSNGSSSDIKLQITDSPAIPSIEVSGDQTETEVVTITCSAVTPCPHAPPKLTWDLQQGTANVTETNGTPTIKITHTINLTDSHDGKIIKCSAAYPVSGGFKTTESTVALNVTYGPKDTSVLVSPSGSLSAGQSVTLSCSSRAKPPVHHFTWFRRSSQGTANVSEGQTYSFNFTEEGEYYCVASNAVGNKSSPVITLGLTGTSNRGGVQWDVILGAVIGVIIVICLGLFVWRFKVKCQSPKVPQQQEIFVQEMEESIHYGEIDFSELKSKDAINPDDEPKEETIYSKVKVSEVTEEETIHYGELDFSKLCPKDVSNTEQEDTVYSQVQVSKPADTTGQVKDGAESLYASVKKN